MFLRLPLNAETLPGGNAYILSQTTFAKIV